MRRLLAAAAALSFVLFAAGCSGADQESTTAAPAAGTTATATGDAAATGPAAGTPDPAKGAAGDAALAADTAAICAQAARTSTNFGTTFAADHKLLTGAASKGAEAKAQAQQKATRDVESFSYALLDMSKLAGDPGLKKALAAMGAQVAALKGDLSRIDDRKLAALRATLDRACGKS
ncbi:hypothetical protein [Actinoplanes teichomyceticus]|uniref:Small secreted protein n=1 Tax=Actinoplanes teichomyceticus TaxID=1867 RepID=A0A561WI13_ACTTI|nr:hypothetical protein [Actinoplanes teichomyceticus]TWG23485.1 hypothetical protein FHX34_10231 [Actinoplanes teichomyceticus]GIF16108.1 hypothetical protein Ate01nite_61400 [Actinoplanes teichomyceticus]